MTVELRERVQDLYRAFGDVPKPAFIPFCDHCRTADMFAPLLSKDLHEITADEFWQYAQSAFLTVGSLEDFLYFCPRLLELTTDPSAMALPDLEVLIAKLKLAEWSAWPEVRRKAVEAWSDAVFAAMSEVVFETDIDSWVCGMAQFRDDVAGRLNVLLSEAAPAAENLLAFYEANSERLMLKDKLTNAFWSEDNANYGSVVGWLKSEAVALRMNAIYEERLR